MASSESCPRARNRRSRSCARRRHDENRDGLAAAFPLPAARPARQFREPGPGPCAAPRPAICRGVPYQCLPKHWAYSRNSPCGDLALEFRFGDKIIAFSGAFRRARRARGARDRKHRARQLPQLLRPSVDLPEPDGPGDDEDPGGSRPASFIRRSAPVPAVSRSRI